MGSLGIMGLVVFVVYMIGFERLEKPMTKNDMLWITATILLATNVVLEKLESLGGTLCN